MILLEPERTSFDLTWRMFDTEVRVHPLFWIVSAFMGWGLLDQGWQYLSLWVLCVFLSILLHEFGHVVVGRLFGSRGHIVLYSMGGLAIGSNALPRRWQRIAVSAAGPLAQLGLYAVLWLVCRRVDREALPPLADEGLDYLLEINLFWPLLNLLPVWPLDGGQITRELCGWLVPGNPIQASLGISFLVAGVLAIHALMAANGRPLIPHLEWLGGGYLGLFFGLLAASSFLALQQGGGPPDRPDTDGWFARRQQERDPDYWKR